MNKCKMAIIILFSFLMSCSGGQLSVGESYNQSVLVQLKSGDSYEGIVVDINNRQVLLLRANTKVMMRINETDIRSIIRAKNHYDLEGYIISEETYLKEKEYSNSLLYSLIGGLSGSLLGGITYSLIDSDDTKSSFLIGMGIGGLGGGYYGYTVGDEIDVNKAVDKIVLKRKALKNIEKELEGKSDDN